MNAQTIQVPFVPCSRIGTEPAHASQYDVGRIIQVAIIDGSDVFEIPSDAVCTLLAKKPDNTFYSATLEHTTEYVTISTEEQLTIVDGKCVCEIRIATDDYTVSTANFLLIVEKCPSEDTDTESESTLSSLQSALEAVEAAALSAAAAAASASDAADSAEAAATSADEAESAAVDAATDAVDAVNDQIEVAYNYAILAQSWAEGGTGTRDGEDTDNAEYWNSYTRELILEDIGFSRDDYGCLIEA